MQLIPFTLIGANICFYGKEGSYLATFMQALISANYIAWLQGVQSIGEIGYGAPAWEAIEKFVYVTVNTLLALCAMKSSSAVEETNESFVLAQTLFLSLVQFFEQLLFRWALSCDFGGEKEYYFPNGAPQCAVMCSRAERAPARVCHGRRADTTAAASDASPHSRPVLALTRVAAVRAPHRWPTRLRHAERRLCRHL